MNALKWAYMGNVGDRAISALITFVLAGILGPHDFGLVSIAIIYVNFVQMVLEQGFASALIQKKDLQQEHCDAVFWLNLAMSLCFVVMTILMSRWWGKINHAPDLAPVLSVLSVCIPIEGLSIVQSAMLRRELDFRTLTIRSNISSLIGGAVGLVLALAGFNVWALVGMQIVRDSSALILLWNLGSWRPKLSFSYAHLKELLKFSGHVFAAGLGTFADLQMAALLLGILFGPVAVGLYRLAERLMNSIVAMATTSIQGVSLPEFARLQDIPEELKKSAISCIRLSSIISMPALAGLAIISGPLMATLGPKWMPSTNVLRILCIQAMIFALSYFTSPLLTAIGRPQLSAKLEWSRAVTGVMFLTVTGVFLMGATANRQLIGIALARAIPNALLITPVYLTVFARFTRISVGNLLSALSSPILASISIVGSVSLLGLVDLASWIRPVEIVVTETVIGGAVGIGVLLVLDQQLRSMALGLVNRFGLTWAANR